MQIPFLSYFCHSFPFETGNWSSFRNEMLDGKPTMINLNFANSMPEKGKLEFDFSSGIKPPKDSICISDNRLVQVLINHNLLQTSDREKVLKKLENQFKMGEICLDCDGKFGSHNIFRLLGRLISIVFRSHDVHGKLEKSSSDSPSLGTIQS